MKKKKNPKKLKLNRETLRGLEEVKAVRQLRQAVGGVSGTCHNISGCPRGC